MKKIYIVYRDGVEELRIYEGKLGLYRTFDQLVTLLQGQDNFDWSAGFNIKEKYGGPLWTAKEVKTGLEPRYNLSQYKALETRYGNKS